MSKAFKIDRLHKRFSLAIFAIFLVFCAGWMCMESVVITTIGFITVACIGGQTTSDSVKAWKKKTDAQ